MREEEGSMGMRRGGGEYGDEKRRRGVWEMRRGGEYGDERRWGVWG